MPGREPTPVQDDFDRLAAELETARAVAQGNKRHVAILTRAYEELEARALASDARERLARHLFITGSAVQDEAAKRWDAKTVHQFRVEDYLRRADELLAVITDPAA